jgi:hypothetical protein
VTLSVCRVLPVRASLTRGQVIDDETAAKYTADLMLGGDPLKKLVDSSPTAVRIARRLG